jgi:predicted DNA-binding transcriptional regulator YafY
MLVIVPYLVQHAGSELGEVARLFDVPKEQLRQDIDLLFLSGLPPYGPGDLIDVEVDEEERVWISMADHFARPLRLTRREALAVYVRGHELAAAPGLPEASALASALEKLRAALGDEDGIETAVAGVAPQHLETVREAARGRRRLRIDYVAATTGEHTTRTIEPEEVFASLGSWYVAAWDVEADDERLFRVDRILEAEPQPETFEPRGLLGAGRALYSPTSEDVPVRLRLHPSARWVAEYYVTVDLVERDDGTLEVTLPARRLDRIAGLLLRLGQDAEILEPAELSEEVREMARRTLAGYR